MFFNRIALSLNKLINSYCYSSEPISIFSRLYKKKFIYKGTKKKPFNFNNELTSTSGKCIEVLNGICTNEEACLILHYASKEIEKIVINNQIKKIVIWNGQQIIGMAATMAAKNLNIKTIFLEISNLPNKIFSNSLGVNANSTISKNPELLEKHPEIDDEFHNKWIEKYEAYKKNPPPQALKNKTETKLKIINNVLKLISIKKYINKPRYKNKIKARNKIQFNYEDSINKYVFLPLQVSNDTQLKLHSKIDNIEAIKIAAKFATEKNLDLLIKIHPAEKDKNEINKILNLKKEINFHISERNTIDLINDSELIITINSTVGLEALIYKKNIICLGNAFYKNFTQSDLKKYIHSYLIDNIDYFSNEKINENSAKLALEIK